MSPAALYIGGIVVAAALLVSLPPLEHSATASAAQGEGAQPPTRASREAPSASAVHAIDKGQASSAAHLILLLPSAALLFALPWPFAASIAERDRARQVRHNVGFAGTGVVCIQSGQDAANFLLILNRNLRDKKGLWVPPGGHVDIFSERPEERVRQKVVLETGYETDLVEVHGSMLPGEGRKKYGSVLMVCSSRISAQGRSAGKLQQVPQYPYRFCLYIEGYKLQHHPANQVPTFGNVVGSGQGLRGIS